MKIWKAIRTAAARFFGIRQREQERESEKQQQDDAQNGAQSGESVQTGISSQDAEKAVTEDTGRQEEGEKELPAEIQTLPEATMKQIHELIEYEERISQIADMTGADPDLIKSRIEEYAKMKEKTPLEAANEVKAALHLRDAYVEAAKAANEMMQDLARRLGEAFDQLGDIVKDIAEDLERIMQQVRETLMTSEKRRAEIRAWRRYYEARAKASNNYRRMHGLPMVRRPRRRYGRRSKPPDGSGRGTRMQQEDKEVEIRKIVQDTMEAERKIQRNRILYNTRILMEQYIEMRRHVENAISEVEEMDATEFESLMQENTHLERGV